MNPVVSNTIDAIQSVIGSEPALLHTPVFEANELAYVSKCVTTGWVSSVGSFVTRFEEMLSGITGAAKAIACSSGTSALFISLKLVGIEPDDEVLIPALTFVATANAVSHCGAIPHLVDVAETTLGIDCTKLERYLKAHTVIKSGRTYNKHTSRPITAIVPMHCFGHPSAMAQILELANEFNLKVVEDAAESLGSYLGEQHTGTFGDIAAVSFNGNKIVTTGGGGAILTNNIELGNRAKHLTTTAKVPHQWNFFHDTVGYNLRMPNLNAALGCGQLEQLKNFVDLKRTLANQYQTAFESVDHISFVAEPPGSRSNYWLNAILLDKAHAHLRDELLQATNERQIMTRPAWEPMQSLPMYQSCPAMDLSQCDSVQSRLINIPSGVSIAQRVPVFDNEGDEDIC